MSTLFASPALAARIDRAEGQLCASIARLVGQRVPEERSAVFDLAGGVAVFAGAGSPTNKMIGVGFAGLPDDRDLDRVEQAFAERHAPLQAEVSTLAEPALHMRLVQRGYQPRGFENMLGHALTALDAPPPGGVTVERAARQMLAEWVDVVVVAFGTPDTGGVGGDAVPPPEALRNWAGLMIDTPGFEAFVARVDGGVVGAGALRLDGAVAQFCGAATLPGFRRRGVQTALLRARLRHARQAACDVAVVTTQPASKSQQNVQREGFQLLYARQLLVKE